MAALEMDSTVVKTSQAGQLEDDSAKDDGISHSGGHWK